MQEEVGVAQLLERGAERRHQVGRQVADEAHRVGDDHLALAREAQPPRGRVERREQLVLDEHVGVRERAQQRALAGVRVADDREHRARPRRVRRARRPARWRRELRELALEPRDAVAHAAAVDLELRLAGAAAADAAGEPREARSRAARAAAAGTGAARARPGACRPAVAARCAKMSRISCVRSMTRRSRRSARLRACAGREVVVEDHEIDVELEGADHELLELAGADQRARVDLRPRAAAIDVDDLDAGRARQLAQLRDGVVGVVGASGPR